MKKTGIKWMCPVCGNVYVDPKVKSHFHAGYSIQFQIIVEIPCRTKTNTVTTGR